MGEAEAQVAHAAAGLRESEGDTSTSITPMRGLRLHAAGDLMHVCPLKQRKRTRVCDLGWASGGEKQQLEIADFSRDLHVVFNTKFDQ